MDILKRKIVKKVTPFKKMASFKGYLYIEFLGSLSMCFSMLNFWGLVSV